MTDLFLKLLFNFARMTISIVLGNLKTTLNFPTLFSAEFPHSLGKKAGISKHILSFSALFL